MICEKCGQQVGDESSYCRKCGTTINKSQPDSNDKILLYTKDWTGAGFYIAAIPRYDILVGENDVYILEFPRSYASLVGLILGLAIFSIFGAIAGAIIGNSYEKSQRGKIRSAWISPDGNVSSNKYTNNIFLQAPTKHLKKILISGNSNAQAKKSNLNISHSGKSIELKYKKGEYEKIIECLNKL